jgi:hypothetical protein
MPGRRRFEDLLGGMPRGVGLGCGEVGFQSWERIQGLIALLTELSLGVYLSTTVRTDMDQFGSALLTEPGYSRVLMTAIGTSHNTSSSKHLFNQFSVELKLLKNDCLRCPFGLSIEFALQKSFKGEIVFFEKFYGRFY